MSESANVERLTSLDLLMPGTSVQALLVFETAEPVTQVLPLLQQGLDSVVAHLPWVSGRLLPTVEPAAQHPALEIRWDASHPTPIVVDKGSIPSAYEDLSSKGMPPRSIPADVWPSHQQTPDEIAGKGTPIFAATIFRFADAKALGLCVSVHHNAVDATGFTELLGMWARAMRGLPVTSQVAGNHRLARLAEALQPDLDFVSKQSVEELWASHPEHSKMPPVMPSEFSPCTTELFKIRSKKVDELKQEVEARTGTKPTTTNILTAVLWQAVTRARAHRNPTLRDATTRLVTAVNGRGRIGAGFSTQDDPYLGNAVLYALAELPVSEMGVLSSQAAADCLAGIASAVSESQSTHRIDRRHVAEMCSLVSRVDDYRGIFVGWDLFSCRDLTVTSWNGLDLYSHDFGKGLGSPQHVRPPYVEADGVGMILPRKLSGVTGEAVDDAVEVMVMLRRDDMAVMMKDGAWVDLQASS